MYRNRDPIPILDLFRRKRNRKLNIEKSSWDTDRLQFDPVHDLNFKFTCYEICADNYLKGTAAKVDNSVRRNLRGYTK